MPTPSSPVAAVTALIADLDQVDEIIGYADGTAAEDQLKVPVSAFLKAIGNAGGASQIAVSTEHALGASDVVSGVRLDMAVRRGTGAVIGHVELKAPSKSANPKKPAGWSAHDKNQWKKLQEHPNLIYCNGREWTLWNQNPKAPTATASTDDPAALIALLDLFLAWTPIVPTTPKALAKALAPLARLLRDSVHDYLSGVGKKPPKGGLPSLYATWSEVVMPGADHKKFADSFAQVFTYGLLLARMDSGHTHVMKTADAAEALNDHGHKLLSSVLQLMSQPASRKPVEQQLSLLETTIGAVVPDQISKKSDPWMYFYEDFLAAYDQKMRKQAGVYYTPVEVIQAQARLVDTVLTSRFGEAFSSDEVKVLDPAVGTGPYLMEVARRVLDGNPAPADAAEELSRRLYGFELLVGPYAVAHMRLTQQLEATGTSLADKGVNVFLTDTLTDPGVLSGDNEQSTIWEVLDNISEENRRAGLVKSDRTSIRVVLGNPPYQRTSRAQALGQVRVLDHRNVVLEATPDSPALIDAVIDPLKAAGGGQHAKNLYNFYVFFWRWAIWKACEQNPKEAGVVSFITASSFLRGPAFSGLRELMRREFDEFWIIDLGGDNRGARPEPNVFKIETPVCIAMGVQRPFTYSGKAVKPSDRRKSKAKVHYQRIHGTAAQKLAALADIDDPAISPAQWTAVTADDWGDRFVPSRGTAFEKLPQVDDVFPWMHSGVQFKRKWPIGPTADVIVRRWESLYPPTPEGRAIDREAFVEASDLSVDDVKHDLFTSEQLHRLSSADGYMSMIAPQRYGYRSFDRQCAIPDRRLCARPRPELWQTSSPDQIYLVTLNSPSTRLGKGPALTVSAHVPDLHFFRGSFGGRSVMPLWRDSVATDANLNSALAATLEQTYGREVGVLEIASYSYGLLGTSAYTERFDDDLEESVARVPFTSNAELFTRVAAFGRDLLRWATYGERAGHRNEFGAIESFALSGKAHIVCPTSRESYDYPADWKYDADTEELRIGEHGVIGVVSAEVHDYEVSGMKVLSSWLGYRMKTPAGKKSSPLDSVSAENWVFDSELLELLWVIEYMVAAEPTAAKLLDEVMAGTVLTAHELGTPTESERTPPKTLGGDALDLDEAEGEEDDDVDDEGEGADDGQ